MLGRKFTLAELSERVGLSEATIKRYVTEFQDFLGIDAKSFDFLFSQDMMNWISVVKEQLAESSYYRAKQLLIDGDYWEKIHQFLSDRLPEKKGFSGKDQLDWVSTVGSSVGALLAAYYVIKQELSDHGRDGELEEVGVIADELRELRSDIGLALKKVVPGMFQINWHEEGFAFPDKIIPVMPDEETIRILMALPKRTSLGQPISRILETDMDFGGLLEGPEDIENPRGIFVTQPTMQGFARALVSCDPAMFMHKLTDIVKVMTCPCHFYVIAKDDSFWRVYVLAFDAENIWFRTEEANHIRERMLDESC